MFLKASQVPPLFHFLHKPLRVISSNTRDFYSFKVLATSSLLVQVILSRPVEALTPILVPVIKFLVAHIGVMHPFNSFLLNFRGDELFLKSSLELDPCSIICQVGC